MGRKTERHQVAADRAVAKFCTPNILSKKKAVATIAGQTTGLKLCEKFQLEWP